MGECRHCGERLSQEPHTLGARCPVCREPLYERTDAVRRSREAEESRGGICAVHAGNVAVGACKRCGTFMCGLCRSRWTNRIMCLACVERQIGAGDTSPDDVKTQRWQAMVSVLLGFAAWILALPVALARGAGSTRELLIGLLVLAVASLLPSLLGMGQAAAVIRSRGDRMVLATCGLVLCGVQIGTVMGLILIVIWKQ
jgi:hypothetical protein